MDVSSFFSRLRQQVNFHLNGANEDVDMGSGGSVPASAPNHRGDREDDGYLLVGETRSERTTVHAAGFSSYEGPDAPPTYGQVEELPSYSSVLSGEVPIVAGSTMFSRVELSPLQSHDSLSSRGGRSAVCDVPFQLHPSLTIQQSINAMFENIDLSPQRFNWSRYSHDFMNEKLCLRDLNCDEQANIDEFILPGADPATRSSLPSNNSGVNLIQL